MIEKLFMPEVFMIFKVLVVFLGVITLVAVSTWAERRGAAFIQDRVGPNRVKLFGKLQIIGLSQPLADGIKLFFKEEVIPSSVNRVLFVMAPMLAFIPAMMTFAAIPFGRPFETADGGAYFLSVLPPETNIGILYVFAISSMAVYGVIIGAWSSNNKWSILGGMRAAAQMVSYELAMTLSVVGIILSAGSLRMDAIVSAQFNNGGMWNIIPQILGAIVFFVAMFAETNRLPFDFAEGESEIVGYHAEYGSMKFSVFALAEYAHIITASGLFVTLYLGGWHFPWITVDTHPMISVLIFICKLIFMIWVFIWVRWTLPRFRYDQLMKLGWKVMLPMALINMIIVAVVIAYRSVS